MSKKTKPTENSLQLAIINPHTAAIDIGSMLMMVSYTNSEGEQCLLETDGFTSSLENLAKTLKVAGVTHVGMEATGVYWIALYEILERYGFIVTLINPRHFKNVDAQKSDVKDCQWLHQLHAHGLLRASHIAPETFRKLKSFLHEREILQKQKSSTLNRIHRLLTQMNVKIQHLISDMEGVAGMKILRGIAAGLTDPAELLSLIDVKKLKAEEEDLFKSLEGDYKQHFILILENTLKAYDFYKSQMLVYDTHIEDVLKTLLPADQDGQPATVSKKKSYVRKNQYSFNAKGYLEKITGVDLTQIPGLDEIGILDIISVTGTDMSRWKTASYFTSWLNLSPRPKISGGKVLGYQYRFTKNKATQAFRLAAQSMWKAKGSLGHLYRRLSAQKGSKKAIKAVARKLAVIFYQMLANKTEFDKKRIEVNMEKQKEQKIRRLQKEAFKYGLELKKVS